MTDISLIKEITFIEQCSVMQLLNPSELDVSSKMKGCIRIAATTCIDYCADYLQEMVSNINVSSSDRYERWESNMKSTILTIQSILCRVFDVCGLQNDSDLSHQILILAFKRYLKLLDMAQYKMAQSCQILGFQHCQQSSSLITQDFKTSIQVFVSQFGRDFVESSLFVLLDAISSQLNEQKEPFELISLVRIISSYYKPIERNYNLI